MSKVLVSTPTEYKNSCNDVWQTVKDRVVAGNSGNGAYRYVALFKLNPIEIKASDIIKITLYFYRPETITYNSGGFNVACSSSETTEGSVLSTGVFIMPSTGYGWKSFDVSALKESIASFSSPWYLVCGNQVLGTANTSCPIMVSENKPYLEIEYKDGGSKIYLASGGTLVPYALYHAENGVLVPYDIYRAENGTLVKY